MKILLINPPYQTITSNLGAGHQIPLGLLMAGGALLDAGHEVQLLDAECRRLTPPAIVREARQFVPDIVLTGHAGSTPAHPVCVEMLRALKAACPSLVTVYGGVYPTYHARTILAEEPSVDVIVRGEGEATTVALVAALASGEPLEHVPGLAYRAGNTVCQTPERAPISDLDSCRVGWELIPDWERYQCFGLGRAAIVQFSRGCPHRCTYCGQHGFWVKWRHRDPIRLADEIEWLYRTHDIRFFTLADENPTTLQPLWQRFLEEVAARRLPIHFFATIRATDIVRDAALLPLYRQAGILYVLMGIETTNAAVIKQIKKGSTPRHDLEACRLLKQHGIFSILGHIVGLEEETVAGFRAALQHLIRYDGDYLLAMYVTPHSWTQFAQDVGHRAVVQPDQRKWDYRHQVLGQTRLRPWQLFAAVKWLEMRFHLRLCKLREMLLSGDRFRRRQCAWTLFHTGLVWLAEVWEFLFRTSFTHALSRPSED